MRPDLDQRKYGLGRRVVFQTQYSVPDGRGPLAAEDGVDQAVELVGELMVGERVLIVAGRKGDFFDQLGSVAQSHGHPVGNARGITGCELGVFDDFGARNQVGAARNRQAAPG